tara:strand:- start:506 stop:1018 length:513 start_codon:yes stop_codon:yes gene_type:complete
MNVYLLEGWREASIDTITNTITGIKMQNTGIWNSDEAIFYFLLFVFPIGAFFFVGIFTSLITAFAPFLVYLLPTNRQDIESQDFSEGFGVGFQISTEDEPVKKPKKSKKPEALKAQILETTDKSIIDETISGLVSIGYKKSQARGLVNKLAVSKVYKSSEVLLRDIISSV